MSELFTGRKSMERDWEDAGFRKMAQLLEQGRKNEKARSGA